MTVDEIASVEFVPEPGSRWVLAATAAGGLAVLACVLLVPVAAVVGVPGLAALAVGTRRAKPKLANLGAASLVIAVALVAVLGGQLVPTVVAGIAVFVAWDLARSANGVGAALGKNADTGRLLTVHVVSSVGVGVLSAAVGASIYLLVGPGFSLGALFLLVLTAAALAIALSR